ncbi:MAG TPA: DNA repair protein RecN [Coriobacteriia bacterium]
MLEELHVRDLALIDDVWLELGSGLTVLTGETGAGKTVLVEALKLLLGDRADSTMVRSGSAEAVVEGRFALGSGERLVRRRLSAEGRSRCYLDGEIASVGELAEALGPLVDLHGQHDHQALLSPARHAAYLDRAAGEEAAAALEAYRAARAEHARALESRDALAAGLSDRARRAELLRLTVEEIERAAPRAGEDGELEGRLPRLRHGERLAEAASHAFAALRGEDAACDRMAEARSSLAGVDGLDPALDALTGRLDAALAETGELGVRLRDYGESVDYDPAALNDAEARLAALAALKKKYGPTLDDVIGERTRAESSLEELLSGEAGLEAAEVRVVEAETALREAAATLTAVRAAAAPALESGLAEAAAELAMPKARFAVSLSELPFEQWTDAGPQRVEFLFAASAEQPRPLARIASGGEVSRVMLALKGVLGAADEVPILVFDEVDAGIGGATALAVGRRLAQLARRHQVLVVTHLAQVAAFADRHQVVSKEERDGRTVTRVCAVEDEQRVAEVARMLAGSASEAGLAHARELMATAREAS